MNIRNGVIATFGIATAAAFIGPGSALAEQDPAKIHPESMSITDADGNPVLLAPIRVYTEYQYGTSKSDSGLSDVVDYRGQRVLVGADFITPGPWLFGLALSYTDASDDGSSPFATIDTDKIARGISFYVAKPILPNVAIGGAFYYEDISGQSIYNGFDVNHEDSDAYGFSGFVSITKPLTERLDLELRPYLRYSHGAFNYDLNVPPTASTESTSVHLPATLSFDVTEAFSVSGMAMFNYTLDEDTFPNVPAPSDATVTVEAGASYDFGNGTSIYGSVNHVLFDSNYDSTSFRLGMSYAFLQ
ncbi:autotransporter outer membrane beta-barrel domain-containing protein [Mesorhizobium xinjiangense]|uniref:autotransporter outer membrane beta-barrel domain-containing protein n=1 Tax=Mesorhizobium xinjiangense TaxID=2678685 RepID=UPI0012EDA9F7|nr:autotransporter outer membrane beta-barrel domain-containing protein [Mesorhizobium xinjiangense]